MERLLRIQYRQNRAGTTNYNNDDSKFLTTQRRTYNYSNEIKIVYRLFKMFFNKKIQNLSHTPAKLIPHIFS